MLKKVACRSGKFLGPNPGGIETAGTGVLKGTLLYRLPYMAPEYGALGFTAGMLQTGNRGFRTNMGELTPPGCRLAEDEGMMLVGSTWPWLGAIIGAKEDGVYEKLPLCCS